MKATFISKLAVLALPLIAFGTIYAQTNETQPKKENVIHIKMIKNINGTETVFDTTITGDDISWEQGMEMQNIRINQNMDSLMKMVEIEMTGLEGQLGELENQLKSLEGLKELETIIDIRGFEDLKNLENLKGLEGLGNMQFDIRIDSNFSTMHDGIFIEHFGDFSNVNDSNVTIMILDEKDAEYQKIMKEIEEDKEGNYTLEKRIMVIQQNCEEGDKKGDKKIVQFEMIVKTCNIEDLTKDDKKQLKSDGRLSNDNLKVDELNFYPNPNNGRFNLGFTLPKQGDTQVLIFNMEGKNVYEENLPNFTGTYKNEIDISNNSAGVYFIKVTQNGHSMFKKMILQ